MTVNREKHIQLVSEYLRRILLYLPYAAIQAATGETVAAAATAIHS